MKDELPHNLEVEKVLLASVLLDEKALEWIIEAQITQDDFYSAKHRLIFRHIRELSSLERPIDLITLTDSLDRSGDLDKAGGASYLSSLTDGVPVGTTLSVHEYCRIVRRDSRKRQVANIAWNLLAKARNGTDDLA